MPIPGSSNNEPSLPQPIVWKPVPTGETNATDEANAIVWTPVPETESIASGSTPTSTIVWEVIPDNETRSPGPTNNLARTNDGSATNEREAPPAEVIAQEAAMPPRMVLAPPLLPSKRSIARLHLGMAWLDRTSASGFPMASAGATLVRRSQPQCLQLPERTQFRRSLRSSKKFRRSGWSRYSASQPSTNHKLERGPQHLLPKPAKQPDIPGGSTGFEDGLSSGFRIARAIGETGGIAFGGEQVIQWDDQSDQGRNLYLMASNGWWLGSNGKDFPRSSPTVALAQGVLPALPTKTKLTSPARLWNPTGRWAKSMKTSAGDQSDCEPCFQ